jgi:hypothetical protein
MQNDIATRKTNVFSSTIFSLSTVEQQQQQQQTEREND